MTKYDAAWVAREEAKRAFMAEHGLWREEDEHSSCGVGLVVSIDGKRSRKVVEHGIDALKAVTYLLKAGIVRQLTTGQLVVTKGIGARRPDFPSSSR